MKVGQLMIAVRLQLMGPEARRTLGYIPRPPRIAKHLSATEPAFREPEKIRQDSAAKLCPLATKLHKSIGSADRQDKEPP